MSLKRVMCVASFSSAVAITLYGAGCGSSSGGNTSDSGGGGQEATVMHKDSGGKDVQTDIGPIGDSSTDGGGGGCTPPATVTYTPTLHQAPAAGTCTAALVNQIVELCFLASPDEDANACNALLKPGSDAANCLTGCMQTDVLSPTGDNTAATAWGALIINSKQGLQAFGGINVGGCVAALDPSPTGQKCALDFESSYECLIAACNSCPGMVTSTMSLSDAEVADYVDCENAAAPSKGTGPCSAPLAAINTDCATELSEAGPGPAGLCFEAENILFQPTPTDTQVLAALKVYFGAICVPAILDGGVDGL